MEGEERRGEETNLSVLMNANSSIGDNDINFTHLCRDLGNGFIDL